MWPSAAHAWFLEIVFVQASVCMCPPLRPLITSHMKYMRNNWKKQFTAFPFHYMTLAVDKLNGCGLSNSVRCEHLLKKMEITQF